MKDFDTQTAALVVIDLQNGIVSRETFPHASSDVVQRCASLAEAFRKNSLPVFLVRVTPSLDGNDALRPVADVEMPSGTPLAPAWAEIVSQMGPEPTDFVITKHQWGAFYGTELDLQLRRRDVQTIVLCGISTNIGVESTARVAYEYGYNQVFAEDAMGAFDSQQHSMTVEKIFPRIGRVRGTADILTAF